MSETGKDSSVVDPRLDEKTCLSWKISGLDCPSCAQDVEDTVASLKGVRQATLVYATATLEVEAVREVDEAKLRSNVVDAIRKSGHDVRTEKTPGGTETSVTDTRPWLIRKLSLWTMWSSGILLVLGFLLKYGFASTVTAVSISNGLFFGSALIGLVPLVPLAIRRLAKRKVDVNTLMVIAVVGAFFLGEFGEAAMVVFLFAVGEALEELSMKKTRDSIKGLMELAPRIAHLQVGQGFVDTPVEKVAVGSTIRIMPGENVPLDGVIVSGSSSMDEAALTGESVPLFKSKDDTVYAGTLSTDGALQIKTESTVADSTLARIVDMVEEAQANKSPYESLVDRFASKYTPFIIVSALLIASVPPLISTLTPLALGGFSEWFGRAIVLLVISCPCALVISTPVSIVSAIARAAQDGVLVKGGAFLELAAKTDTLAYDKTGTLTQGRPTVDEVVPLGRFDKAEILSAAAALEEHSTHPLGKAIVAAHEQIVFDGKISGIQASGGPVELKESSGRGIKGLVGGHAVLVGNPTYLDAVIGVDPSVLQDIYAREEKAATVLVVSIDEEIAGLITVMDHVRESSVSLIEDLRLRGIRSQVMLTGDNVRTAAAIAQRVGVDEYRAGLLPQDKGKAIQELQDAGGVVAMVGDGINDAPALALADVGIAMGGIGSDTALQTADVTLMADDLSALPRFFELGKRTMSIIKQNITFAIVFKLAVFVLAIAGIANLWMAVFADTGVALLVILNGMRLLRKRGGPLSRKPLGPTEQRQQVQSVSQGL